MKDFSKYLKDGRRVAAFGQQINNEVEIFLLYCSKKDQFSKEYAKYVYSLFKINTTNIELVKQEFHPTILRIPIKEGDSAEYTFKLYMRDNFYKVKTVYTRVIKVEDYLVGNGEVIKKSSRYETSKLSM